MACRIRDPFDESQAENLDRRGRAQETENREERFQTIAEDRACRPQGWLVVSPDYESRREGNVLIQHEVQEHSQVQSGEHASTKVRVHPHETAPPFGLRSAFYVSNFQPRRRWPK